MMVWINAVCGRRGQRIVLEVFVFFSQSKGMPVFEDGKNKNYFLHYLPVRPIPSSHFILLYKHLGGF